MCNGDGKGGHGGCSGAKFRLHIHASLLRCPSGSLAHESESRQDAVRQVLLASGTKCTVTPQIDDSIKVVVNVVDVRDYRVMWGYKKNILALLVVILVVAKCSYLDPKRRSEEFASIAQTFFQAAFERQTVVVRSRISPLIFLADADGLWELGYAQEPSKFYAPAILADRAYHKDDKEWFIRSVTEEWPDLSTNVFEGYDFFRGDFSFPYASVCSAVNPCAFYALRSRDRIFISLSNN